MFLRKALVALLLVLLAIDAVLSVEDKVIQQKKECAPGCTDRGNCNAETGQCECPWGYTGPACEVDRMAACRQTPDDPGSCGTLYPKHCDCYLACQRLYCDTLTDQFAASCAHELGEFIWGAKCWTFRDATRPVTSRLPPDFRTETRWWKHYPRGGDDFAHPDMSVSEGEVGQSNWSGGHTVHPLEECPGSCSHGRGVCFKWGHAQQPECLCRKGFNGTACEAEDASEACWFSPDCGGRGRCRSGFCHCRPGFFGTGCHRSTAFQPTHPDGQLPDLRPYSKLKIYMYDLPWDIAFPYEYNDGHFGRDAMYKAYEYFMEYFLADTVIRTENPYEANLFYVPMLLYFYIGNVRDPVPQASRVLNYVRRQWPFYNRTGGRDHFYFMTGDRGTCSVPRWMQDEAIKVVHFGLQTANLTWQGVPNKDYGCVQIKRDLVVPPINMFTELRPVETESYYKWLVSNGGHDGNRTLLFFFAGGVGDGTEYSGGVRQAIKALLSRLNPRPPDVEFLEGRTESYRKLLQTSNFCIAPYGYGWGLRLVQAIEYGCIPIIIQDHVYQAFEDFLPYEGFSVRMSLSDVPRMVELLRSYSESQLAALRLGLAKYWRAFVWNREYGGMAYEWTLVGLERRLAHVNSEYFRHRHHHHRHHHRHLRLY